MIKITRKKCGWSGTIAQFLDLSKSSFIKHLNSFISDASHEQINAWEDCYLTLKRKLELFRYTEWYVIFEYLIPREGGRRPDVLMLLPGRVIILEFKMYNEPDDADWEQLASYVRDLSSYHEIVNKYSLQVSGALVLTSLQQPVNEAQEERKLYLCSPESLYKFLTVASKKKTDVIVKDQEFLDGNYERLPSIIEAARLIMENEPLPNIRSVNNTNIPGTLDTIRSIIKQARLSKTHHLILVNGVPGAGKTLVGLLLSHELEETVYLSGNRSLVNVLQDALGNKTFVQSLRNFKNEYGDLRSIPNEHIFIFDEAQRAWDKKQMNKKMGKPYSEPELMVKIAQNQKDWSVIIGLIGEGQEIHEGEEGGLPLWNNAISKGCWTVHSHQVQPLLFSNAQSLVNHTHLNLNMSLRSHTASDYHHWVNNLLTVNHQTISHQTQQLVDNRYTLYVTRNIETAREFVNKRYLNTEKQAGLMSSSRKTYGHPKRNYSFIQSLPWNNRYSKPTYVSYFNDSDSEYYSSRLQYAISEFDSQGLELDLAIVCWGYDLRWNGQRWNNFFEHVDLKNDEQIRLNCYRVLLTRGRDGTILYIPKDSLLDQTYELFRQIGVKELTL